QHRRLARRLSRRRHPRHENRAGIKRNRVLQRGQYRRRGRSRRLALGVLRRSGRVPTRARGGGLLQRRRAPRRNRHISRITVVIVKVATADAVEIRSPYSGKVVGQAPKIGADEARRAVDAAARALDSPLPAHKRAEILIRTAGLIGRRHEEVAHTISEEAGKPIKTARVEASRAMSTYTFAGVEPRLRTREA